MPSRKRTVADVYVTPAELQLLKVLGRQRGKALTARALVKKLADLGYPEYDAQRTMQRAMDRGLLELGPKLRLQSARGGAA